MSLRERRLSMIANLSVVVCEVREDDLWRSICVDLCSVFYSDLAMKELTFADMKSSSLYE